MYSTSRWVLRASVLAFTAVALACAGDGPSSPPASQNNRGSQGATTGSQPRSDVALSITPNNLALRIGTTGQLVAAVVDANGNIVQVPTGALPWASSNAGVATVSDAGIVSAVGEGEATISLTTAGVSATARVAVSR